MRQNIARTLRVHTAYHAIMGREAISGAGFFEAGW